MFFGLSAELADTFEVCLLIRLPSGRWRTRGYKGAVTCFILASGSSMSLLTVIFGALSFLSFPGWVSANLPDGRLHGNMRPLNIPPRIDLPHLKMDVKSPDGRALASYDTVYYFDQLIDHNNPSAGTFKQRYWHTYERYQPGKYPHGIVLFSRRRSLMPMNIGGPVILMTPGEVNADGNGPIHHSWRI
jgi:hypothetical protein